MSLERGDFKAICLRAPCRNFRIICKKIDEALKGQRIKLRSADFSGEHVRPDDTGV
jgi:hypothetical protein